MKENLVKYKKLEVFKKYKLYVEVIIEKGEILINQKLNSFFGQVGIYEGNEKLIKFVEFYFKSLLLNFFDHKNSYVDLNEFKATSVVNVPLIIYFYFADKRCDFFINYFFIKKFYYDRKKISSVFNFFKLKYIKDNAIHKLFYFNKMKEYLFLIKMFSINFKTNRNFFNLFNIKTLNFIMNDDKTYLLNDELYSYLRSRKKKIFFFKKLINRCKNNIILFNKNISWLCLKFILNIIIYKFLFITYEYDHMLLYKNIINILSQIYNIRNKFFRKFRRYKRFKKAVFRNFFGKKISYYKIYRFDKNLKRKNVKK